MKVDCAIDSKCYSPSVELRLKQIGTVSSFPKNRDYQMSCQVSQSGDCIYLLNADSSSILQLQKRESMVSIRVSAF